VFGMFSHLKKLASREVLKPLTENQTRVYDILQSRQKIHWLRCRQRNGATQLVI
jgi:hypothetical protein